MRSAIYTGKVFHGRLTPKKHSFIYNVFMMFVNLDDVGDVCAKSIFWRLDTWFWPASFVRKDFHGDPSITVKAAIQKTLYEQLGVEHKGPIFMLANWRYFGFCMNPLVVYYCYDMINGKVSNNPKYIVAEVTNTPWRERCAYVNECNPDECTQVFEFSKNMHVSPFNGMDMRYKWLSTSPAKQLSISLENYTSQGKVFSASLQLESLTINAKNLRKILIFYPVMTVKVIGAIYWQALKLLLKRVPVYSHPDSKT